MDFQEIIIKRKSESKLTDEEVWYIQDRMGVWTAKQLGQLLKTGKHDNLREMARDELIARITLVPKWIWMCSVLAILLTIAVYSIQLLDRFSSCIPHPAASSASLLNTSDKSEGAPKASR